MDIIRMSEIGLFEAICTARAQRRLKPDPVPAELITRMLDAAIRAPSGGNAQNWIFIVVRDEARRHQLGAVYRKAADEVAEIYAARGRPSHGYPLDPPGPLSRRPVAQVTFAEQWGSPWPDGLASPPLTG
jgi:hypothetical protein